ncbi:hypothetical protein VKT23_003906 [Stygiomarasmius scandens]
MSSLNSRGGWNYASSPRVKFFGTNSSSNITHNSSSTLANIEVGNSKAYDKGDSRVFVQVESHEMRDRVANVDQLPGTDRVDARSGSDGAHLKSAVPNRCSDIV